MSPSEESKKIAGDFHKYTETADKSLIKDIPADKLEIALLQYSHTRGSAHFSAMEMRLNELKEANRTGKWSRDQKIAFGCLVVAVIALFFQINSIEQKIQPVIEMKPQIKNVINNITEVRQEIANLNEMLKQQDRLTQTESFTKNDISIKVRKIFTPDGKSSEPNLLLFELKKIPLKNSVHISGQANEFFRSADIAPSQINVFHNIVTVRFIEGLEQVLTRGDSFFDITYLPDVKSRELLFKVQDASCMYGDKGVSCDFTPKNNDI